MRVSREQAVSYEQRLNEYLAQNVHPETARNIGRIVQVSPLMSAEGAMNIILQMQLDHVRKDEEIVGQEVIPYEEYMVDL